MDPAVAKSDAFCRLADVLEEGRPWTVEDRLRLVRELTAQAGATTIPSSAHPSWPGEAF